MKLVLTYWAMLVGMLGALAQENIDVQIADKKAAIHQLNQELEAHNLALEELKLRKLRQDLKSVGIPALLPSEELVEHTAMCLVYNEAHEQAKWVAHIILPEVVSGNHSRSNDFRPDPLVKTGTAVEEDFFLKTRQPDNSFLYDGFGYDRGHLAPQCRFPLVVPGPE
ncbi:MAG: hypothetical protein HC880_18465 [Bacteroidia bacterium]|nr:hypothetical protein [Bacteroidia bacterium]